MLANGRTSMANTSSITLPAGSYTVTLLAAGRLSCETAMRRFARFLQDRLALAFDSLDRQSMQRYGEYHTVDGIEWPSWFLSRWGANATADMMQGLVSYIESTKRSRDAKTKEVRERAIVVAETQLAQRRRVRIERTQLDVGVEVPADDADRPARLSQRPVQLPEIAFPVHEERERVGGLYPPRVAAGQEDGLFRRTGDVMVHAAARDGEALRQTRSDGDGSSKPVRSSARVGIS
jgi:hypothetical protein